MSLLSLLRRVPEAACQSCRHFARDGALAEAALPGMASLSSAHASVRAGDGLCLLHDRLINGRGSCSGLSPL